MNQGSSESKNASGAKPGAGPSRLYRAVFSLFRRVYELSSARLEMLFLVSMVMVIVSGYLALVYAPSVTGGSFAAKEAQRIFYFHVPAAWVSLLAFGLVFGASMVYLRTKEQCWDQLAYASAEVGVLFCTVAIVTGPFWAKAEWDAYWSDDPKLTVTLVLWLIYIGYLIFRNSSEEDDPGLAAILSVFGFITIPLTFFASRVLTSQHPNVVASDEGGLEGKMVVALVFSVFAFTMLFYYILVKRFALLRLKHRLEELKTAVGVMLHG